MHKVWHVSGCKVVVEGRDELKVLVDGVDNGTLVEGVHAKRRAEPRESGESFRRLQRKGNLAVVALPAVEKVEGKLGCRVGVRRLLNSELAAVEQRREAVLGQHKVQARVLLHVRQARHELGRGLHGGAVCLVDHVERVEVERKHNLQGSKPGKE